ELNPRGSHAWTLDFDSMRRRRRTGSRLCPACILNPTSPPWRRFPVEEKFRPPAIEEFRMSQFLKFDTRFRRANSPPCITARRGGCVTNQMVRSHRKRRSRGGFPSRSFHSENPPVLVISGVFAASSSSLGHPSLRCCEECRSLA